MNIWKTVTDFVRGTERQFLEKYLFGRQFENTWEPFFLAEIFER